MENNIELYLLKLLLDHENFKAFFPSVNGSFLADNSRFLGSMVSAISEFHDRHPEKSLSPQDLYVWYNALYPALPKTEKELLVQIVKKLESIEVSRDVAEEYIRSHQERAKATEIALLALQISEGKADFSKLIEASKSLGDTVGTNTHEEYVTDDLGALLDSTFKTPGLRWRLKTLNQMLGSLRRGDFGFIFKRPETGGTTLLASEITHMATQVDRPILWVNNEEAGSKVKLRCYEAYFGKPLRELSQNWKKYADEYQAKMGGKILLYDRAYVHKKEIDRLCAVENPALIIFDQIDKIKGFSEDRHDLEMKQVYQWARELAKAYGPTIGICQASVSAENKQWLTMDDVDSSKTAKQGEADWMLGIGKQHKDGMENVRYFHVVKNKLLGDEDSLEEMRHGKAPVIILPQIARFADYSNE